MSGHQPRLKCRRKLYYIVRKDLVNVKALTVAYMVHKVFECKPQATHSCFSEGRIGGISGRLILKDLDDP